MRPPSELGITTGSPFSITATQLFVVPRSMPITLPIMITSTENLRIHIVFILPAPSIKGKHKIKHLLLVNIFPT